MNVVFEPYTPAHMDRYMPGVFCEAEKAKPAVAGLSFAAIVDGHVIGMAGLLPQWPGRAIAWVLTSNVPLRAWPAITRETRRVVEAGHDAGYRRIEMTVRADHPAGHRWAEKLGFRRYCALPLYGPDGSDHIGYVKIRGDA